MASALTAPLVSDRVAGLTSSTGDTAPVIAPFTGAVLHDLPLSSAQDVTDATAAARVAQKSWRTAGFAHRRAVLLKAHDLLLERRDELLDILQTENGKTRGHAFEELAQGIQATRYYALIARRTLRTRARRAGVPVMLRARVGYKPKGVVGVITPWNFPIALGLMDIVPALAAGNAVVQKADNQGALSILASRRAFIDAGVPAALWAVVAGDSGTIGNAVVDAADYVAFTGSTVTGTKVGLRAMAELKGASLELGGKNPLIVLDDVKPVAIAPDVAAAVFSGAGQVCVSIERIYVLQPVADAFIAAFVAHTKALTQGPALDFSTDVGSLTSEAQLTRVQQHVDDAVDKGATVLAGGTARPDLGPYFFEPTILTGVTSEMECFTTETFGPLVAIEIVDSEEDAIAAANASEFGLNASVFSGSIARARRIADRLDAGSVNINDGYRATFGSIDAPQGGMKHSGLGRRNGVEGILRYVEARTVAENTGLMPLPRTGAEWARMSGLLVALLKTLKALRRR
jgi:succinate-semialdehyde dehydrogenase/glutarate-semialdehyde dehydrogenase